MKTPQPDQIGSRFFRRGVAMHGRGTGFVLPNALAWEPSQFPALWLCSAKAVAPLVLIKGCQHARWVCSAKSYVLIRRPGATFLPRCASFSFGANRSLQHCARRFAGKSAIVRSCWTLMAQAHDSGSALNQGASGIYGLTASINEIALPRRVRCRP